jgi:hypothetical protein
MKYQFNCPVCEELKRIKIQPQKEIAMDKIKTVLKNLGKLDLAIVISGAVVSLGILVALIVFAFQSWKWLVGIGVPVAVDAALIAIIVAKVKKALSATA